MQHVAPEPAPENGYLKDHALLLLRSLAHWTGRALVDPALPELDQARALFEAPFVVLSHDGAPDPVFTYGNRAAMALFELSWGQLTAMPSRLSAEPDLREARDRLLADVARQGYVDGYSGVRVASSGRRFRIEDVTVWNLLAAGRFCGQAAVYSRWTFLDEPDGRLRAPRD